MALAFRCGRKCGETRVDLFVSTVALHVWEYMMLDGTTTVNERGSSSSHDRMCPIIMFALDGIIMYGMYGMVNHWLFNCNSQTFLLSRYRFGGISGIDDM